ncbi:protein SWEETIE-like [Salvia splendens]|uniref:protein SWEETIE-like n=1 Tax=Salvia splendens TaxID=180675 RepID=UPI001C278C20|nr:protein SWEETIE-like [Salvia splendens]
MARNYARENMELSRLSVLVAQLESIVASAAHKPPDALLCFDLLSDLISAIEEEPKESVLQWQRKCEDTLYSLLVLGARRPVRHLASVAMANIILKGDSISIYSRASSLQGFLSDGKRSEAQKVAGASQCLGILYRFFGRRIVSGLLETTTIVSKLLKFNEDFVRQEALRMLHNALEGSDGSAASAAYTEAFRVIMRVGVGDKSPRVKIAAARCLKAFANIGGPGLGIGELENCLSYCVKALEDPVKPVRDAFADALGALLALGMNPDAQVQPKGKGTTPKKLEGGLQKHLAVPFSKVSGPRLKDVRIGISLSWVCFLQAMCLKYLHPDSELQNYAVLVMDMLRSDTSVDAQALACVLYIVRVGMIDQMSEPIQRGFSVFLAKQLLSSDSTPSMRVAALRTLSYVLKTLGEVPHEFKEVLDDTVVAALSHNSALVRVEAALTIRMLAEVDPSCVGGLISYAMTMLSAARENVSFQKVSNFKRELDSLHGLAAVLASLVSTSPKLPLGYPTRLPKSILDVCKKMLMKSSRNPIAASVEKEAGWNLLSSLLTSVSKEELHDQVFDILALWASTFSGNTKNPMNLVQDRTSEIGVWSAAIDALMSCIKCFLSSDPVDTILLQPVLLYLNGALSFVSQLAGKERGGASSSMDVFIVRVLSAYQALSDPSLYESDHASIIQICTTPFREASRCDESSCLRMLLDKRDAWLGPWTPGRDWFEDELRSFQGGKDGVLTCVWENEPPSFPQPETISKMLVNQMLLSFGTMFASQDSRGMLSFLGMIDQCLKAGKRQSWHAASVTNICVGLLAGLKTLLAQRSEPLGMEILTATQSIFQSILAEGDICASQRRASSEGLGLLARLGNDTFTARLTKQLLGDVTGNVDSHYSGSIALALGCIHCSAGGMALSSLVPNTVNVVSSLAKSSISSLQIWSLHGLLLTIEAAGLSYVSQVQATLGLAMEIILSEGSGWVDLQQAVGRLINAIVAVTGPELAPGSVFFSRCKSAVAEISSSQETATLLESVRFTQQLVLFAPQAVPVHSHVLTLLPTLSSRQPTLRHLALSTLRHLIEKDPVSIIDEQIEETLFYMLDEETDPEIGNLARSTIMRLLHASCPSRPSRWLSICRKMILSTSRHNTGNSNNTTNDSTGMDGERTLSVGDDDESMVSSSKPSPNRGHAFDYSSPNFSRDKHLRYRTRVFAAECLNHLPEAVGDNPAHFDLSLARAQHAKGHLSGDWLVLQLQEIISLAYQISTIQLEKMRPIGVTLLCTIMDKFAAIPDPELPDHLLVEQYQAQLVSAVRSALDSLSGPILLEAGLQLATKMLTSGIISRDQVAVKRIFSLISRPLDDFNDLFYPSYAEWVSCKIKVRLLMVYASLKCYMFASLREQGDEISDEYLALLPLFAKSSSTLGTYWLSFLKDYNIVHFHLRLDNWEPFLDGIQSSVVSAELHPCLEEAWPVILQALVLDAVPANSDLIESPPTDRIENIHTSGHGMVEFQIDDFNFLWGFLLLILFQEQDVTPRDNIIPVCQIKSNFSSKILADDSSSSSSLKNIFSSVFQFMSTKSFFSSGYLSLDVCTELLKVFSYLVFEEDRWDYLAVFFLSQVIQNCPNEFLLVESFTYLATELCLTSLFKVLLSCDGSCQKPSGWEGDISVALNAASTLLVRSEAKMQLKLLLPFLLIAYKCIGEASTEMALSRITYFSQTITSSLKKLGQSELEADGVTHFVSITRASVDATVSLTNDCVQAIHQLEEKRSNLRKMLLLKLSYSVEQLFTYATLVYTFEGPRERQEMNPVFYRVLHHSIECARAVLTDPDIQIQAVVLQVVKVMLQKRIGAESDPFLIFYLGELVGDIFVILHNILENPINREAVAIAGECLKFLMLLQTVSKECDYEKGLIHLILESVLMIFATSDSSLSPEAHDLQSIAVKLVAQLAQTPSSASSVKDILLAMPTTRRQQLQDIIRASVVQDKNPQPMASTGPPLVIKLPSQTPQIVMKNPVPLADPPEESNNSSVEDEDEEDEEDDWDTFQSFPASGNETAPALERSPSISGDDTAPALERSPSISGDDTAPALERSPSISGNNSGENSDDQGHSPSTKEGSNTEDHEFGEAASTSYIPDGNDQIENSQRPQDGSSDHQQSVVVFPGADEVLPNIQSDQIENQHTSPSVKSPKKEDNQTVLDVQCIDSTDSYENPSNELCLGISLTLEQCSQPTELSADNDEPSIEHPLEENNNIDQNISVVSTDDSEDASAVEESNSGHHEKTSNLYEQPSLAPNDSENGSTMLARE